MTWLARKLPPCTEITRAVSDAQDRRPSAKTWIQIRLHMIICELCARYEKQLHLISKLVKIRPEIQETLSAEKKEEMKRNLTRARTDL